MSSKTGMGRYSLVDVTWTDVKCTVAGKRGAEPKDILKGCSGSAHAGRILSIMGPSGAGKTTIMDILAGRLQNDSKLSVRGEVLINGQPAHWRSFWRASAYVQQEDHLPPTETVRECLMFNAQLRLPRHLTRQQRRVRAEAILEELGLQECADTLVGSAAAGIKGISGGQKRRTSIGLELVTSPSCIFLDEPTSGLDSEIAVAIMQLLKQLAGSGRTVALTIHQPNSDITALFDDFILLAHGHTLYSGVWSEAVTTFGSAGFQCPAYTNPTDYFMKVASDDDKAEAMAHAFQKLGASNKQSLDADGAATRVRNSFGRGGSAGDDVLHNSLHSVLVEDPRGRIYDNELALLPQDEGEQHLQGPFSKEPGSPLSTFAAFETAEQSVRGWPSDARDAAIPEENTLLLDAEAAAASSDVDPATPRAAPAPGSWRGGARESVHGSGPLPGGAQGVHQYESSCSGSEASGDIEPDPLPERQLAVEPHKPRSALAQLLVLCQRQLRAWRRHPIMLVGESVQYVALSAFFGGLYFDVSGSTEQGVFDRGAAGFLIVVCIALTPPFTAITVWQDERMLVRREVGQSVYSLDVFFWSKTCTTFPFEFVFVIVVALITYFMYGFQHDARKFFIYWAAITVMQLISESLGMLFAMLANNADLAVVLLSLVFVLMLSLTGFLTTETPVYYEWFAHINYLRYATAIIFENEMSGLTLTDAQGRQVPALPLARQTNNLTDLSMSGNFGVLVAVLVFVRLGALVALKTTYRLRWL